ncbi:MAG: flagellum-specific ATP synthase FliI [Legionellales bacterium]|nr:flagellum-specific ATP synthase FliI [Legionellales bacterium]
MKTEPFDPKEYSSFVLKNIRPYAPRRMGVLSKIVGLTFEAKGLRAPVGSICCVEADCGRHIKTEVVGFESNKLFLMPLSHASGLRAGAKVFVSSETDTAIVGSHLMGQVVDATGEPLDGSKPKKNGEKRPISGVAINPMKRKPIDTKLDVGVKAINSLLTLGRGQRIGLVAGSGVGKSVLLGMLTKFTAADVVVIGLIGERGREVKEFIETTLGKEGLRKTIVVAAPADESPLLRIRGTQLAHTYAEFFREQGQDVLLVLDSLSRVAHAQREIGLAIGEPPTTKGYPPSVFSLIPKLIERAGTGAASEGSITAIYTLLAEGDDLNDPVVDIARASLDGQVVLSRSLADAAHYPAIDLMGSISRLMPLISSKEEITAANNFRRLWTLYKQSEDLINVGAYEAGSNSDLDKAIQLLPQLENFLRQDMDERFDQDASSSLLRDSFG